MNKTRFLVDEPANLFVSRNFGKSHHTEWKKIRFEVEIKGLEEIRALKMGSYLAVGEGSDREPKLIVMKYMGNPDSKEVFGLVGKGITYDSGGLSIKPTPSMLTMKTDMTGGATIMSTIAFLASQKYKVNVVGVIAACENVISGHSYKPGNIVTTMAGKTIFIGNTDGGRLTLVDAIHYAIEKGGATEIIDVATLTGAAIVALGGMCSAILTNNEELRDEVLNAAAESGEYMWELPNFDMYKKCIEHFEADYTNTTSGFASAPGTITAGQLLGEFVQGKPWVHIDLAGPSHMKDAKHYYGKGATGHGVKTLVKLFKNRALNGKKGCEFAG